MIACTSISPSHINSDIQDKAVKSWLDLGFEVYSFNSEPECKSLCLKYPDVNFISTNRTVEHHFGKPLVTISTIIDWAKENDKSICIINSDIELKSDNQTVERVKKQMDQSIVLCNRVDYDSEYKGNRYLLGIDVFFIHKKFLPVFPQSLFCFGQCFWDYWLPYTALKSGIDVCFLNQNIAFHKKHTPQYNNDMWKKAGRLFIWEKELYQFQSTTEVGKMSTYVYNFIYNASKRIEI